MLYYTSPVLPLSYIPLKSLSHPHSPLTPLTILKSAHPFHFPLYSFSVSHLYPPPLPFPCDMHLRIHYVMLSACIQFTVRLVFKEVMTFLQWAATKWKGYTSMSEWTPADGDDNDIVSSASKLELVVFKLTNVVQPWTQHV